MFAPPPAAFHFSVVFELPQFPSDIRFKEVSGLSVSTEFESVSEGGENRFTHQLPTRLNYGDLTLRRGAPLGSGVSYWARKALEEFSFKPANLLISLLNEKHLPIWNWYVVGAVPKQLEMSSFDAMQSEIVIETLVLSYQYFTYADPVSAALDAAGAISGSVSVSV
ncbi:phage tail protein [Marimonas arenosa]|uniref:Phage tail protein n=1 Tax=Marimonas arenosa TaxID=1795305 RepID=A0AAE4B2Z0_9RHOB|nr:phage tail protein [Marimonas arenosa]MDQ2088745.1 phage tail protein [Marimonas arenosa]